MSPLAIPIDQPKPGFRFLSAPNVVLFLLCLMYLLTYIDRVNFSTASNAFDKEMNLNKTQVGFIFSAFAYPYLIFQVIGGYFGDRFGARRVLTICSLVWAGATILMGFTVGFWSMVVVRLLLGLGEGATFPTATSAMSSWVKPANRGFAQGFTHAFARVGNSLAPPVITALVVWTGWRGSFIVAGIISIVWVGVWFFYFRDDPALHPAITPQDMADLPTFIDPAARKRNPVPWGPLAKRMFPVFFVYFCYGWTLWLFLSWIPQYFKNQYHLDLKDSALFSMGVFFAGVVGDTLGGILSDWLLRKTGNRNIARTSIVVVFFLLDILCILLLTRTSDINLVALSLAGAFFCAEMTIGAMWSIPMDIAPKFSGSASGFMNCGSALAAILSPVIGGYLIDRFHNWNYPFYGSMGLLGMGMIVALWMKPNHSFDVVTEPVPVIGGGRLTEFAAHVPPGTTASVLPPIRTATSSDGSKH